MSEARITSKPLGARAVAAMPSVHLPVTRERLQSAHRPDVGGDSKYNDYAQKAEHEAYFHQWNWLVGATAVAGPAADVGSVAVRIGSGSGSTADKEDCQNDQKQQWQQLNESVHQNVCLTHTASGLFRGFTVLARGVKNIAQVHLASAACSFAFGDSAPLQSEHHKRQRADRAKADHGHHLFTHIASFLLSTLSIAQNDTKSDASCAGACPC